jgi:hypothetical protein
MKKLFTNTNPFILLLAPVMFALIMGVSYQFEQKLKNEDTASTTTVHPTSLFFKGITLVKAVCSISKQDVW